MDALKDVLLQLRLDPSALWLIIALPLVGAFICGVFGRMLGRANVYLVACAAVAGSFLLSVSAFLAVSPLEAVCSSSARRSPRARRSRSSPTRV